METGPTKTQIDRLGERLKKGDVSDVDLHQLDAFRLAFKDAYESVVDVLTRTLGREPTGRPAKSTTSITQKLKREHIRLTQIQDIAGCRVIVRDIAEQEEVLERLLGTFPGADVVDRRLRPSHGYRAVHVVLASSDKLIEVQLRTELQHLWAELSEKLSDVMDPAIKYGGGPDGVRLVLARVSSSIADAEADERRMFGLLASGIQASFSEDLKRDIAELRDRISRQNALIAAELESALRSLARERNE